MLSLAKVLLIIGGVFILGGVFLLLVEKVPGIRKLPGDILIKDKEGNNTFYFPVVTCIIISILLSIVFSLFNSK